MYPGVGVVSNSTYLMETLCSLYCLCLFKYFVVFQEDEEEGGDDDDDDDGFFVPHGYLSDDEGAQEEEV